MAETKLTAAMFPPQRAFRLRVGALSLLVAATFGVALVSTLDEGLGAINVGRGPLWWFPVVGAFLFLVPGVVVLLRSEWHPVGWLLVHLGFGFLFSFGPDNPPIVDLTTVDRWWLWLTNTSVSALFWTVWSALILVFPDRLSSRRGWHRRLAWGVLGVDATCVALTAFTVTLVPDVNGGVANPMPLSVVPIGVGGVAAFLPNVILLVVIVDFVVRYRRAEDPVRSQYRWVVWAFLFEVAALLTAIVTSTVTGDTGHPVWLLAILGYLLVPVSFAVAILRYRLYDIDLIVSRTLTYAGVALALGVIYTVPVIALPRLFGESNDLVIAVSTLAAAAVFNPVRRRIQRSMDRRFNRARYDAEREVEDFSTRLHSELTVDAVAAAFDEVVARTVQPAATRLWIRGNS